MNISALVELLNKVLDIFTGIYKKLKGSPAEDFAKKEENADAAIKKAANSNDTSGILS